MKITKLILSLGFILLSYTINYSQAFYSIKDYRALVKDFFKNVKSLSGFVDWYLLDLIPFLIGAEPALSNGTLSENKEYFENDKSNEAIKYVPVTDMIERPGFQYIDYHVLSTDGYVNQLINIINPLADRTKLKKPPIILFHGGLIDPSVYVWASNIQHHPEKWPRTPEDGPITSWNRSLAFVLANNGYDVWLVGSRGSNHETQHKNRLVALKNWIKNFGNYTALSSRNETVGEQIVKLFHILAFYNYDLDDITINQIPPQLEKVMNITGAKQLSILSYSFSTMTTLSLLSLRPNTAKMVKNLVLMAPIISAKHSSLSSKIFCLMYRVKIPEFVGEFINRRLLFSETNRAIVGMLDNPKFKYTVLKLLSMLFSGSSAKYRSFLEPAVPTHSLMETTYRQISHFCQQVKDHRLQKYDYGYVRNLLIYGKIKPPMYNISSIKLNNWMLISSSLDNLAPPSSVQQIMRDLSSKPNENLVAMNYNHIDLVSSFDNDIVVNLPILAFLDKNQIY